MGICSPGHGIVVVAALCALLLGASGSANRRQSAEEMRLIQQVVELTNAERARRNLPPLRINQQLNAAADWMAHDLAKRRALSHTDTQGRDIVRRITDNGYDNYNYLGENIAKHSRDPAKVVAAWMNSPGHRANILNPNFREIGVGYAPGGSQWENYWAQNFGAQFDRYPVVINNESAQTRSPSVKLFIHGEGWAKEMRLSNDGTQWTPWQRFRSRMDWTLERGSGLRTVYVELRKDRQTCRSLDTIELVASGGDR
jgi:uncharacterized protein YkwD